MPLGLALHLVTETTHTGMSRDFLCLGGVRLHFPVFTRSVSYLIFFLDFKHGPLKSSLFD